MDFLLSFSFWTIQHSKGFRVENGTQAADDRTREFSPELYHSTNPGYSPYTLVQECLSKLKAFLYTDPLRTAWLPYDS